MSGARRRVVTTGIVGYVVGCLVLAFATATRAQVAAVSPTPSPGPTTPEPSATATVTQGTTQGMSTLPAPLPSNELVSKERARVGGSLDYSISRERRETTTSSRSHATRSPRDHADAAHPPRSRVAPRQASQVGAGPEHQRANSDTTSHDQPFDAGRPFAPTAPVDTFQESEDPATPVASDETPGQRRPQDSFNGDIPDIPRTGPRNTERLVELLEPLTRNGVPLQQVLIDGMGRFPVAGHAYYFDDWLDPRYTPSFHLHKGLDILADLGTPIRAPDEGIVTRFSHNPRAGGIGVWLQGSSGDAYYFAHLLKRPEGLRAGQRVKRGTVVGYVGDTGNARGGPPHLHFETHRGGPIPPKPLVDRWLDEAEEQAPAWVEGRRAEIDAAASPDTNEAALTSPSRWSRRRGTSSWSTKSAAREDRSHRSPRDLEPTSTELSSAKLTSAPFGAALRSPGQLLVALGLVFVGGAVAWRLAASWGATRRLLRALGDPDPSVRASAVEVATAQGLARHSGALATLVRREPDREVLGAVAEAVGRNLWEPGDNRRVVELRLWADQWRRQSGPISSNGHDPVAKTLPLPAATPATLWMRGPWSPDGHSGEARVLVTGAGGPAGVAVVRALADRHLVIAADADPLAAGLRLAREGEVLPTADDPEYIDGLVDVVRRHRVQALIPTLTEEMVVLSEHSDRIARHVATWLSPRAALETCRDKWRFACAMRDAGLRAPATSLGSVGDVPGPWVVKPRFARGSRGVHYVEDRAQLEPVLRMVDDPIVQTRLRGREFTVDALVSRTGELVGAVPRWRLETKAGISTKGRTFSDDCVLEGVAALVSAIHLEGAVNVQGFVDGDEVSFLEVNPRFSGGLPLSLAAGSDLVGEYLRGVLGLSLRCERLAFREGTTMIRHFEEIYA